MAARTSANESETSSDPWELLAQAIRYREQVVATYGGRRRVFCPHALGIKRGRRHALVFQVEDMAYPRPVVGSSGTIHPASAPGNGWRCLDVDELSDVMLRRGPWHSAANVFGPQTCMDEVHLFIQPFPPAGDPAFRDEEWQHEDAGG